MFTDDFSSFLPEAVGDPVDALDFFGPAIVARFQKAFPSSSSVSAACLASSVASTCVSSSSAMSTHARDPSSMSPSLQFPSSETKTTSALFSETLLLPEFDDEATDSATALAFFGPDVVARIASQSPSSSQPEFSSLPPASSSSTLPASSSFSNASYTPFASTTSFIPRSFAVSDVTSSGICLLQHASHTQPSKFVYFASELSSLTL
jgi:hypothetical protein